MILYETTILEKILQQPVLKELFAFIAAGMCFFLQGFTFTYNAFIKVGKDGVSAEQASISGSVNFLLMFLGFVLIAKIMNKYGRKKALQYVYTVYIISGVIISFYNEKRYYLFYLSRVFSGLGNSSIPLALLYISEVCHKSRRGIFGGSISIIIMTGFLTSYTLQYNFHLDMLGFFSVTIASVSLLMACIIPETKYWYLMKNRHEDAERSSLWFNSHQTPKEMYAEFDSIAHETSDGDNTTIFTYLRQWPNFKRFLISQMLLFSRAMCGRAPNAIFPDYFYSSFHLTFDAKKLSLGAVLFEFVSSIIGSYVIGRLNRRTTLFFCLSTLTLLLSILSILNMFVDLMNELCPWLEVICLYLYSAAIMAFISPLTNLIIVETVSLSNQKRASVLTFSMSFVSLYVSFFAFIFPFCVENFGITLPLTYFMVGSITMLITVLYFIPETHNKALYECGQDKIEANDMSKPLQMRF